MMRSGGAGRLIPRLTAVILALLIATATMSLVASSLGRAAAPSNATVMLSVMTFNIFYGGDELDLTSRSWCFRPYGCPETLDQVVETIRISGADIVGLQEGVMNTRTIAERLGWHYSERMQIIARYPLIDPPGGDGLYIFVEPLPGRVAALANVHLPADPYGPYEVRDGATLEEVIELEESLRLPWIQQHLARLPQLSARGIPVFLTGDFNTPSHLDWTEEVAAVREEVRYPVEWPVSKALADAGFTDSFREAHPDPILRPGFTWTPGSPEGVWNEVHDRIDWVLLAGPSTTVASHLVGEKDNPDVDIVVHPWPSDHRGVVSTFEVTPGEMPVLVAVDQRRLEVGALLAVRFRASGTTGEVVAIVPSGQGVETAVASQPTAGAVDGTLSFGTADIEPGAYDVILVTATGDVLALNQFWLYEPGAPTTLTTSKSVYRPGEPIVVYWTNAPGMKWDWLGIFEPAKNDESPIATTCSAGYCGNVHYLLYEYTYASIEGSTAFTEASLPGYTTWPLQPGVYEIRLLVDDGYQSVASSAPFKVVRG